MLQVAEKHRYDPKDFIEITNLEDDLETLYAAHAKYKREKNISNRFALEKCAETLFFTLKHRKLEGMVTCTTANEIWGYVENLLYDD